MTIINSLRKECGVFIIKEIQNPLSIVAELTLLNIRRKSGFNQLTLTVSKKDPNDNTKKIIKRVKLVFSKEYYTPDLAKKIASLKTVNYQKDVPWTIEAINGPKEQFKLKVTDPIVEEDKENEESKTKDSPDIINRRTKIWKFPKYTRCTIVPRTTGILIKK